MVAPKRTSRLLLLDRNSTGPPSSFLIQSDAAYQTIPPQDQSGAPGCSCTCEQKEAPLPRPKCPQPTCSLPGPHSPSSSLLSPINSTDSERDAREVRLEEAAEAMLGCLLPGRRLTQCSHNEELVEPMEEECHCQERSAPSVPNPSPFGNTLYMPSRPQEDPVPTEQEGTCYSSSHNSSGREKPLLEQKVTKLAAVSTSFRWSSSAELGLDSLFQPLSI